MNRRMTQVAAALLIAATLGCTGGAAPVKTVPVTGTVMYKGQPVEGATVSFWAEKSPRAATGVTNAQGEFTLSMFKANDGAIPGPNTITVTKVQPGAAAGPSPEEMLNNPSALANAAAASAGKKAEKPKNEIPAKYATLQGSTLKETVADPGPNSFVIQLTD